MYVGTCMCEVLNGERRQGRVIFRRNGHAAWSRKGTALILLKFKLLKTTGKIAAHNCKFTAV